ncbi:NAD(P)H-dependent oxidoreductase [Aggregatimonas sangjinii]|uniref:NAD(P)H-dependent oxidoreductase n=1 Tax=Aggregatimonas sangjinii TaxID=2583587 RepID=A0A5B7SRY9_9FLAO|nr:NAD(P)H-dependent oxidoreductase [Aggregatimonas sangjinii]QCX00109.1 NAD(P)H-dependent oxidoreductase [Aggregatimonas sangjinii]
MTDILSDLNWRYAVKKFDSDRLLSNEKIEKLKNAFNLTATSYGLQPIRLVVLRNKTLQKELVTHSFGQAQVAQASHILIICIENKIDSKYISDYFELVQKIRGTSDEILDPFKNDLVNDFSKKDRVQLQQWSKNQAYLAMGNLLTICAMEKIDACPMEGFNPLAYDELLGLQKKRISSVLVLPVGYRAEDDVFSNFKKVRRPIEESVIDIF